MEVQKSKITRKMYFCVRSLIPERSSHDQLTAIRNRRLKSLERRNDWRLCVACLTVRIQCSQPSGPQSPKGKSKEDDPLPGQKRQRIVAWQMYSNLLHAIV